jgi:uncharacterized protein YjbJ (UPF0337 family)
MRDFGKSRWPEIRELIKMNWELIDDEDIDSLRGKLDHLSDKLQEIYSYSKDRADSEMLEFKKALHPKNGMTFYVPNKNLIY